MKRIFLFLLVAVFPAACVVQTESVEGDTGPPGQTGSQGPKGDPGATGMKGESGVQGLQGPPGATSWTDGVQRVTTHVNVGIGTLSPTGSLDVAGTLFEPLSPGQVTVAAGSSTLSGSGTQFTQQLQVGDAIMIGAEIFSVEAIASDIALTLNKAHSAGASNVTAFVDQDLLTARTGAGHPVAVIDKSGQFGIGTSDPQHTLDVNSSEPIPVSVVTSDPLARILLEGAQGTSIRGTGGDATKAISLQATDTVSTGAFISLFGKDNTGDVVLGTARDSATADVYIETNGQNRVFIDSAGYVGIGTIAPQSKLDVRDGAGVVITVGGDIPQTALKIYGNSWVDCATKSCSLSGQNGWLRVRVGQTDHYMPLFQ